jgi:PadR family transcriptional regulator, regulatory protein PadR
VPRTRRPSAQTVAVLRALGEDPAAWRYGYRLCLELGIKPGSMYPILMRLADRGLLETAWETDPERGRPPRHLYRLTGPGRDFAADAAAAAAREGASAAVPPAGARQARSRPAFGRS